MQLSRFRAVGTLAVLSASLALHVAAQDVPAQPYHWKNVQIVGGGFVDGIIFHPTARGVRYARTDMGGAYRWDEAAKRWQPILDWMPYKDLNLMGVESIAVDPSDPDRVYLACGTYTNPATPNGAILRSADRGKTFQRSDVPFKFGGNENGRGNGERLSVDPADGKVLYLGTRHAGLWRSVDGAATWSRVDSFPDVTEQTVPAAPPSSPQGSGSWRPPRGGSGIVFTLFDPAPNEVRKSGRDQPSSTIYVGVSLMGRDNLFRSTDAGATWQAVPGAPAKYRPTRAALASEGTLYIAYGTDPGPQRMSDGGVWKLNTRTGEWADITPDKPSAERRFGYAGVAVDAHNPLVVIASSFGRPRTPGQTTGGEDIFRSIDGGKSWKQVFGAPGAAAGTYDYSLAPYVAPTPIHWLFDIEIDPLNSDHAMFTTGYGGWETFNLTAVDGGKPTRWSIMSTGIEETVGLELASPIKGAHLISAIGDYGSFVHWDLDRPSPEGASSPPRLGNTTGLVVAAANPDVVVRVGVAANAQQGGNIGYSLDGGRTWRTTPAKPPSGSSSITPELLIARGVPAEEAQRIALEARKPRAGTVSVSADGQTWVWVPERSAAYVTTDRGATWKASTGVPPDTRIVADPVNPEKFYALSLFDGRLFLSSDGAQTFTSEPFMLPDGLPRAGNRGDVRGGQDRLYAAPGREGDLWLPAFNGLYHQLPGGGGASSFTRLEGVDEVHAFGFGMAAPHGIYPALYLVGTVKGQPGIFRSDDEAKSWVRINDDQHQWGLVLQIAGDPRVYGRAYVGTHGRGIFYGDPM
ncbi:MAG TPA: xyloglucanase [Acidisarcina sp.]